MVSALKNPLVVVLLVAGCAGGPGVFGQDPFADPQGRRPSVPGAASGPGEPPPAGGADAQLQPIGAVDKPTRLVIESIRASNPQTPAEICRAIRALLDLDQENDARFYLARLMQSGLDQASLAALMDAEGSDFFLRLHGEERLAPEGREFARAVFSASQSHAASPAVMGEWIQRLGDPRIEVRSDAFLRLKRMGAPAAAALIGAIGRESDAERIQRMRSALRGFGSESLLPLMAGLQAGPLQVRYECATALSRMREPDALYSVAGLAWGNQGPEVLRNAVRQGLVETWGALPEFGGLMRRLQQRAAGLLTGTDHLAWQAGTSADHSRMTWWSWDPEAGNVVGREESPATVNRLIAREFSAALQRLVPGEPAFRDLRVLAWLDSAKREDGPMGNLSRQSAESALGPLSAPALESALTQALEMELYPAAAGACDLIAQADAAGDLFVGGSPALILALQSGDRHVQFAALRAIDRIAPAASFPGSSFVADAALLFAGPGDRPMALVVHPDRTVAGNIAVALGLAGVPARPVTGGRELFQEALSDINVAFLFVADSVQAPELLDLVHQVRSNWRTRRMPMALMATTDDMRKCQRLAGDDRLTIAVPLTSAAESLQKQLAQLSDLQQPWGVAADEALEQSIWATAWLGRIAAEPERYRHFELAGREQQLLRLFDDPRTTADLIPVLGGLGSAGAQRALVGFASQSGWPVELRTAAAQAFGESIRRHGLLLTTGEIRRQYDLYNASEKDTPESQRVLGSILDQIELRAGRRSTAADENRGS